MKILASKARGWIGLLVGLCSPFVLAVERIGVGCYDYPPFYVENQQQAGGIVPDLVELMNQSQDQYEFYLVPTTSRRRYLDFHNDKFDLLLFENPQWGWQDYPVRQSQPFYQGGEVWITQDKPGRDQSYFATTEDKRLLGVLGYHYGFAGLNSDPDYLTGNYSIHLVDSQAAIIELIVQNKADMGIVAASYLSHYISSHPELAEQLLVSEQYDQIYQHGAIIDEKAPISVQQLDKLFSDLQESGKLRSLWQQHGLHHY